MIAHTIETVPADRARAWGENMPLTKTSRIPVKKPSHDLGRASAVLMFGALAACSSSPPFYLDGPEHELGVGTTWYGSDLRIYHSALLYPRGFGLRSPGYIVGIENIHPSTGHEGHVITHVVRYQSEMATTSRQPITSCVLYTMLNRSDAANDAGHRPFERCVESDNAAPHTSAPAPFEDQGALARLRQSLADDLRSGDYSHILVMIMGWNTDQEKAIKNFNSIAGQLADEAAARAHEDETFVFHPLLVGVTWPSQWQLGEWSIVPDAVIRGLSFPNKARDADDVGGGVLLAVIRDSVVAARDDVASETRDSRAKSPRIVLIGHSFGARALVTALTRPPSLEPHFRSEDRLILLEGAFEIEHLFDQEGGLASSFAAGAPRVTMTASAYDSAVSTAIWGWYAGDIDTFDQVCRKNAARWDRLYLSGVGCADAIRSGYGFALCVSPAPPTDSRFSRPLDGRPVRYFDASSMIDCRAPFTSGGAHSDIFRRETARFLMDEMN